MNRKLKTGAVAGLAVLAAALTLTARAEDRKAEAAQAIAAFKLADPTLTNFFAGAAGYAIFPNVGGGGLIIGAEHGDGLLYEQEKVAGKVKLTTITIGAQVGGGTYSEVIFFQTAGALKNFKKSNFEMSAGAKATLAASGAAAKAKYEQEIAVFTLPKSGAMVAASIGGQKFKYEDLE